MTISNFFKLLFVLSAFVTFVAVLRDNYQQASAAGMATILFGGITGVLLDLEEQRSKKQE